MENCSGKKVVAEKKAEGEDWGGGWRERGRKSCGWRGKEILDVGRNSGEVRGYKEPFSTSMPVGMTEFGAHRATSG